MSTTDFTASSICRELLRRKNSIFEVVACTSAAAAHRPDARRPVAGGARRPRGAARRLARAAGAP
jgi:hypothetical protein